MEKDNICTTRTSCRICGSDRLVTVVDMGKQCLASVFEAEEPPDYLKEKYPLELVRCAAADGCGLVQLRHTISPRILYHHYGYRSGINEQMRLNLKSIAQTAMVMVSLEPGDLVCDIGCNDGTLLTFFDTPGIDRLGIDPAVNIVTYARKNGLDVVCDFFSKAVLETVRPRKKAKIITTIAMFYDLEDPARFVREAASLLADEGVWVMEMAYLPVMLKNVSFDTICHEHLEYYSLRQIEWLLDMCGLAIHGVEFNSINGGSIRVFIRKNTIGPVPAEARAELIRIRAQEQSLALESDAPYQAFYRAALTVRGELKRLLESFHKQGRLIYAYGASTKGNTLLQFCGIDCRLIDKAVDRNPDKWFARTPATRIEIIPEEQARRSPPDCFLVLPWHFFEVFKRREAVFLEKGGKFILPLPRVRVVGKNGDETVF